MSLQDATNNGVGALYWTDIRLRKLVVDDGFEVKGDATFEDVLINGDLTVDGTITGDVTPSTISPGANRTFLHTDEFGVVQWVPLEADKIEGGNNDDIIRKSGGVWSFEDKIVNSNLPDPLQVNVANFITSMTTQQANIVVINPTTIWDDGDNPGTAGQLLRKSPGGNVLQWADVPFRTVDGGLVARGGAYNFSNTGDEVQFSTIGSSSGNGIILEPNGSVNLGIVQGQSYEISVSINAQTTDSASQWQFTLERSDIATQNVYRVITSLTQAASLNQYVNVNFVTQVPCPGSVNTLFTLYSERISGAGTLSIFTGPSLPYSVTMGFKRIE